MFELDFSLNKEKISISNLYFSANQNNSVINFIHSLNKNVSIESKLYARKTYRQ